MATHTAEDKAEAAWAEGYGAFGCGVPRSESTDKFWLAGWDEAAAICKAEPLPERGPKEPSANAKEISFIITERRYHRHGTMKRARAERIHLTKEHKKSFRILRVLNVSKERVPLYEAAPEVLQAAKALLDAIEQRDLVGHFDHGRDGECDVLDDLRDAIAKSGGSQ